MKRKLALLAAISALAAANAAHAGPRTSANYSIATETADQGGGRAASAAYTNDGSATTITGLSTTAAPAGFAKHGYAGQLTEVVGINLNAGTTEVGEGSTLQLSARLTLDDATFVTFSGVGVSWSAPGGPITVNTTGLVTGGTVFQSTAATARGDFGGYHATIGLTVLDTLTDNFGSYANDGIDDEWQVQYFGQDNPLAAPTANPDGDLHDNAFEFTAGLVPTDPSSVFQIRFENVAGQPDQRRVIFSPVVAWRTYTVKATTDLVGGGYAPLESLSISDAGNERTVTDLNAGGGAKFYRVQISKP